DPPRRVRRQLEPATVVELLDPLHQAEVPLLHQVEELQAPIQVSLRDRDDQAEVGADELSAGALGHVLAAGELLGAATEGTPRDARSPASAGGVAPRLHH